MRILSLFLLLSCANIARAGDGPVDASNEFPYVIELEITFGSETIYCSSVALSPQDLLTAAHCLIDPHTGQHANRVRAIDSAHLNSDGIPYAKPADKIYVSPVYQHVYKTMIAEDRHPDLYLAKSYENFAPDELSFMRYSQDIGYVHLSQKLNLRQFPKMIFSLIKDPQVIGHDLVTSHRSYLNEDQQLTVGSFLQRAFPYLTQLSFVKNPLLIEPTRVIGLGYGRHAQAPGENCVAYSADPGTCMDHQRRIYEDRIVHWRANVPVGYGWSTVWTVKSMEFGGRAHERVGDSGGPLLMQANDGKFYVAGILSQGNSDTSIYASLLDNFTFYYRLVSGSTNESMPFAESIGLTLEDAPNGAVIKSVEEHSFAARAGFQENDMFMGLSPGSKVMADDVERILAKQFKSDDKSVSFKVFRSSDFMEVHLDLGLLP